MKWKQISGSQQIHLILKNNVLPKVCKHLVVKLFHVNPQTDFLSERAGAFDAAPQLAVVTWQMGLQMALKVTLPVASEGTNLEGKNRQSCITDQPSNKLYSITELKVAKLGLLKYDWVV